MNIFTKEDLHKIRLEEININKNKLINNIIKRTRELVIFNAKNGGNKVVKTYDNEGQDVFVLAEVLSSLKNIFPDSEVKVFSNDEQYRSMVVSVDWS
jgi:hypothetical protein